jgi:hypothetical protein
MCGEEEDPVHVISEWSETKLSSGIYIKKEWGHFGYKILMKTVSIRNNESLKKMGKFLFKNI